jgi:hypothetical protein
MHGDRDKSRVTFYYLLAGRFGKLPSFFEWLRCRRHAGEIAL